MTDAELIQNSASKAAQILHITLPPEVDKLKFIYLYSLLYNSMGQGNDGKPSPEGDENMIHWLNTHNHHLGYVPVTRLFDEQSMNSIVEYLESMFYH